MPIYIHDAEKLFHLQAGESSYILQIVSGFPSHVYWGRKLDDTSSLTSLFSPRQSDGIDRLPLEYPQYGSGDFRSPAYQIRLADGSRITELVYKSYRLVKGKEKLQGLPAVYVENSDEADTLEIELTDSYSGVSVLLSYTAFANLNVITRSARFIHHGQSAVYLERALSASIDFHDNQYDLIHLFGAWTREGNIERRNLAHGTILLDSRRGASSHQLNPFIALLRPDATEDYGDVYGLNLVYSGNFQAEAEVDQFDQTRVNIGLNSFDFEWKLEPNQAFQTPEAVLIYSPDGLGGMSRTFHHLYRTRLVRGMFREKKRPVLVNNWEATYFDFNAEIIESIAKAGAELGIELFVLDDGWFGERNDDKTSLGDWVENPAKLPKGLKDLADRVQHLGMQFGLWVEPEMVSPDSNLYRNHPNWCLHVKGRRRSLARTQLVLDLSRQDVRTYLYEQLSTLFRKAPISYVKWDMNRNMTEIGSPAWPADQQKEISHRYMLGLYELLETLTLEFPHILFESCASGGGRFDPGMLYYMPQTWASDNTDAVCRQKIQYGLSLVYPPSSIGAHVSTVPNHQVGRTTPLKTRGDVAMMGAFGYEMDVRQFNDEEKEIVKKQILRYKKIRPLIQKGNFYRLKSPFAGNETAWMFVSQDQQQAAVFYFRTLAKNHYVPKRLHLKGLQPDKQYKIELTGESFSGNTLHEAGLPLPSLHGDFVSASFFLS
ncbi:alpha-galactosidase [Bacillus sp. CLL-7-23]|uniref:Alpha-galactosidase n=1 Tax=Bacillus changyiensis TaxID=3004103 RepID=A0ABT4X5W6_9BACI|nr:alpha-galactosidase [Bacillus changyiensis]MDA7027676.1 alpha-galactosidase [Bacillus changyiensis]